MVHAHSRARKLWLFCRQRECCQHNSLEIQNTSTSATSVKEEGVEVLAMGLLHLQLLCYLAVANAALYLPWNSEARTGNDVIPELNAFYLKVGFSLFSLALARLAIVSNQLITTHYAVFCACKQRNNMSTDRSWTCLCERLI